MKMKDKWFERGGFLYDIRDEKYNSKWADMNAFNKLFFSWSSASEIENLVYTAKIFANCCLSCLPTLEPDEIKITYTTAGGYRIHIEKDNLDILLGADILTSAGIPIRNHLNKTQNEKDISKDKSKSGWISDWGLKQLPIKLNPSQEAFLSVIYTIGNMLLGFNRGPGGGNLRSKSGDIAFNKIMNIKDKYDKKFGGDAFKKIYGDIGNYISSNYLTDFFAANKSPINHLKGLKEFSDDWCNTNTKLIIQRGYRIHYQYKRNNDGSIKLNCSKNPIINNDLFNEHLSFTCKAKNELQIAFKAVGIPDDNLNII